MPNNRQKKRPAQAEKAEQTAAMQGRIHEAAEQVVGNHPAAYIATCFGIGLGLGVVIGTMLADSGVWSSHRDQTTAERLGRNVLDAISGVLPEQLAAFVRR